MAATVTRLRKPGKGKSSHSITYRGHFFLPAVVLNHPDFIGLSYPAKALLLDVGAQYNGFNNGDLCAAHSVLKERGWKSNDTRTRALNELLKARLLVQTKFGGLNAGPHLYALTWQPIDECGGKLDIATTGKKPYRQFKEAS